MNKHQYDQNSRMLEIKRRAAREWLLNHKLDSAIERLEELHKECRGNVVSIR